MVRYWSRNTTGGGLCPHQALGWIKYHKGLSIEQLIGGSDDAFQAYQYPFPVFPPSLSGSPAVKLGNYLLQQLDSNSPCVFGQLWPTLWLINPSDGFWLSPHSALTRITGGGISHSALQSSERTVRRSCEACCVCMAGIFPLWACSPSGLDQSSALVTFNRTDDDGLVTALIRVADVEAGLCERELVV